MWYNEALEKFNQSSGEEKIYWQRMCDFLLFVSNNSSKLDCKEREYEEWIRFKFDDIIKSVPVRKRLPLNVTINDLNSETLSLQEIRDSFSEKYYALVHLVSLYSSAWEDITRLWLSFNEAKSEARGIGKLLLECEEARILKSSLDDFQSIKSAADIIWKNLLQSSVEIRSIATVIVESVRGGIDGLPVEVRRVESNIHLERNISVKSNDIFMEEDFSGFKGV